jgi:hypothetical protein
MGGGMSDIVIPKQSLKSLGLDWRQVVEDYRTKTGSTGPDFAPDPVESEQLGASDLAMASDAAFDAETASNKKENEMAAIVRLARFQDHQGRKRLDEIAAMLLTLTYGEMIDLADALWQAQPEGSSITKDNLPALLHRWSKARAE